jgi:hypothetical protein
MKKAASPSRTKPYIPGGVSQFDRSSAFSYTVLSMLVGASFLCGTTLLAGEFTLGPPMFFEGAVDCSAATDVGNGFFVGAGDEVNVLRLYDVTNGPQPKDPIADIASAVKSALGVREIKECDLEGAAKVGDLIFWIGSHGRNKDAKERKERQVLVATKLTGIGKEAKLDIAGKVYTKLLADLISHPALAPFGLAKASQLAPKEPGALNIESLAADGDKLWIGFRNPQVKEREALLVPLLNAAAMINKDDAAHLGEPVTLPLGGLGIRDMAAWDDGFLIIAGDFADRFEPDAKPSRLFFWKPGTDPRDLGIDFGDLNPEAIVVLRQADKIRALILSDDGKYPQQPGNAFRAAWLQPASR